MLANLFAKPPPDPKEQAKQWRVQLAGQVRVIDREIRDAERAEQKTKKSMKEAAKVGNQKVLRMLATEIMRYRKHAERLHTSRAQINSVSMQLQTMFATQRVMGHIGKSAELMAMMNSLVRLPEVSATMVQMSKEMTKAGILEEMIAESMEGLDSDELEEASNEEVDKVVAEVMGSLLKDAPAVPQSERPSTVELSSERELATSARLQSLEQERI